MSPGADVPFFPSFAKKSFTIPTKRYKLLCRKVLSNRQYVDENSRMWKISERTAGWLSGLEAVLSEADEDHLRVALIQPGSSRYLRNEVVIDCMCSEMTKRVEPRKFTSLAIFVNIARDFFDENYERKRMYENHIEGRLREGVFRKQEYL